ncbi:uncharacterized protein LOC115734876 isoform X2 [Rhodamnia argentea]|uniref:Uncharacterized protein LOC115734876 isoform X2 n=1 Tax=Rhodamnia argentea TaxID=178133 RepID=A0ABM3HPW4_9MYRT|nr:uncharacterized protein LOC115734876 isoform X2 [Rhodamnia argentea]
MSMKFDDGMQFKDALKKYSVAERREIKFIKNERKFVRAKCADENCPWKISASFDARSGSFHVKTYHEEHTCSISFNNKRVTSSWLAKHYLGPIRAMPTMKTAAFGELIKDQLGLNVSMNQCTKAKLLAFEVLMGNYKNEYAKLWDYAEELRATNPGSMVTLKVEKPNIDSKALFERMYICFAACKKGFLDGCRKVVGLDGCFLKGICKREILCAIGRNANDQMFPIAWAVVRVESGDTWSWFLGNLMWDLNINSTYGQGWVIISDKQKGLLQAVADLLPAIEHRMCARHIYANWGKKYKGIQMQRLFWRCAKSSTMVEYDEHAQALKKISPAAYHDLVQTEPKHWSRAFFTTEVKCDIIDNNLCEAFNGRIIDARCKSIYSMLEEMRTMIMTRMHTQRDACARWRRDCGPRIVKKLEENRRDATYCRVLWNGDDGYEVLDKSVKFVVDVSMRECTCRRWQLTGIPCPHAISALNHKKKDAYDYIDECYKKAKFLAAYQNMLKPVRGERFWKKTNGEAPEPLPLKVKPGRRRHKRLREEGEASSRTRMSRRGMKMTCRTCRKTGHNSLTCPVKNTMCTTSQTQLSRKKHLVQRRTSEGANGNVSGTPIASDALITHVHGTVENTSARQDTR